jgi:ribosomal protein S18 acetylase RimI-like enzyme
MERIFILSSDFCFLTSHIPQSRYLTSMKIKIRKATSQDIDTVIELAVEMVVHSVSPLRFATHKEIQEFRKKDLTVLRDFEKYGHIGIFIAEDEERHFLGHVIVVSGDVESSTGEKQGWIFDLSIKKEWWGKGIGKELMSHAEKFIKEHGLKYIGMGVTTSNFRAVRFYKDLGYIEERKRMIKRL